MGGFLDKVLAAAARQRPGAVALAMVRVPDYSRPSQKGVEHVSGYSRMGRGAMQSHLTSSHGMASGALGKDFSRPESLASWHGADHVARDSSLGHSHSGSDHGHEAFGHLAGGNMVHQEIRRTADRQTRRRLDRAVHRRLAGHGAPPGGAGGAAGASGGSSGSSGSSGSGGSSGGSGSSSGSGRG